VDSNGDHPPADPAAATNPVSSLPSTGARLLAFFGILIAGVCGGLIGYAFVDLQCEGDCTVQAGFGGLLGALIFGAGTGVVAVLALRAMNEWDTIKERDRGTPP
jgi:hypothetical protein